MMLRMCVYAVRALVCIIGVQMSDAPGVRAGRCLRGCLVPGAGQAGSSATAW